MTDYNLGRVVGTDGTGIQSIVTFLEADGRRRVEITLTTGTVERFYIEKGTKGDTGTGIRTIELISTVGKDKNYRITFTDNSTFDYTISDGEDAVCDTELDIESENAVQNKVITGAINNINTTMETKYDRTDVLQLLIDYGLINDGTVTRITLESDKDILSYADSDVATLTATAYDTNDDGVANQIVVFFKDGEVLDAVITDANGEATYEYTSEGSGDIVFSASVGSLLSETYSIEDCIDYQQMTDNSKESRWSIPSAVSSSSIFGYSSDGWKFGNVSSYSSMPLNTLLEYPFSVEFKVTDRNGLSPILVFINTNNNYIGLSYDDNRNWFNYLNGGGGMSTGNVNYNLVNGSVIRVELTSDSIKTYVDDNLIDTRSHSLNPTDLHFRFDTGNNRYNVIKDFKIKPL